MKEIDGYISTITLPNGKTYGLKVYLTEVKPIVCPKCGASFELRYRTGKCGYCGTWYSTNFELKENIND